MIQLFVLSGKSLSNRYSSRRFPFTVGRSKSDDFTIEGDGVWEKHFELQCVLGSGYQLKNNPKAITTVNGTQVQSIFLKNGDEIEMGGVKLQFWLSPMKQSPFVLAEIVFWVGLFLLVLFEIICVVHLW